MSKKNVVIRQRGSICAVKRRIARAKFYSISNGFLLITYYSLLITQNVFIF